MRIETQTEQTAQPMDNEEAGVVECVRVDPTARTMYLKTTTHGLTLEWEGHWGKQDEPKPGDVVRVHDQGQSILVYNERHAGQPRWYRIRYEAPEGIRSKKDLLLMAGGVGFVTWLVTMTMGMVIQAIHKMITYGVENSQFEILSAMLGVVGIATWRIVARVVNQKKTLGIARRREWIR